MNTWALALRNLLRNRRRSVATLLAMVIGAVCLLLFGGYIQNIVYGMQTGYIRSGGHLQVQRRDYDIYGSGDPTAYGIADYTGLIDQIKRDPVLAPMLAVATSRLDFGGIAGNFAVGASRTVMASGTVIADQNTMEAWNDYGFPGKPELVSLTGTAADSAVIGAGVARVLQLCAPLHVSNCPAAQSAPRAAGSDLPPEVSRLAFDDAPAGTVSQTHGVEIELLAATTSGAPNVSRLKVTQAEAQGVKELDDVYVAMHLSQAQRLLYGVRSSEVTAIVLQLQHTNQIPLATLRLQGLLDGVWRNRSLTVNDFRTLNPSYGQTIGLFNAIFGFMAMLIGAIVLFTVGNTMNTAVVERTVEIGTLRAIGLRRAGIRSLFVTEGMLLGGLGAITGVVSALLLSVLVNHSGLTWTPPGRVNPIALHIRLWGENRLLWGTAIVMVMVAVLSAWWPARRAARLQVIEALRHV
jgi:putative ABC transport system permease protein